MAVKGMLDSGSVLLFDLVKGMLDSGSALLFDLVKGMLDSGSALFHVEMPLCCRPHTPQKFWLSFSIMTSLGAASLEWKAHKEPIWEP